MYSAIGVFTGILYAIMSVFNAGLSDLYGDYLASVLVHVSGVVVLWPLLLTKWGRRTGKAPWYMYFGGTLGIVCVIATNVGLNAIGATSSLALALLGQIIASAVFDHFGFFGAKAIKMNWIKLMGILVIAVGAGVMIASFDVSQGGNIFLAVLLLLFSGVTVVLSRISNAHLAAHAGTTHSAIMNHTTGLIGSIILFAIVGFSQKVSFPSTELPLIYYIGGALGAGSVFLMNYITKKLPNVQLTLLLFVGQTGASILIDALLLNKFTMPILLGTAFVAVGLLINTFGDKRATSEAAA